MNLRLDWCSYEAAKYACEHWYNRPDMPVGKLVKIGVWEESVFKGVLLFGCGTGGVTKTGESLGLTGFQVCELCRIALRDHATPLSRIIAIGVKILHKFQSGIRLIVTYANPADGHHGGIYQAAGWIYVGHSAPDAMYLDAAGVLHHSRQTATGGVKKSRGQTVKVMDRRDCVKIPLEPKHKYLLPLDADIRAKVAALRKPYPKRVRSVPGDTSGDQPGEGESTSTRTLHSSQVVDNTAIGAIIRS